MSMISRAALAAALLSPCLTPSSARAEVVYGVTQTGFLVNWNSASPGALNAGVAIQGLAANEQVLGIDFRPATGELYALGSFSRLYRLDVATGMATMVGSTFSTPLNGSSFGFDFNPTVDRIRVVSNADQNLRLNPNDGMVAAVDGMLQFVGGDQNFGANPNVNHSAYTNNVNGALTTTLYGIDSGLDALVIQNPPNAGGLVTVGSIGADMTDIGGFDISGLTGIAYAVVFDPQLGRSTFWTIDLQTGAGTLIGEIGGGAIITAMAVVPAPGAIGLLGLAFATPRGRRRR